MIVKNHVLKNLYRDSVALMRLSREIETLEGVEQVTAIMGTDNNKELLSQAGLLDNSGKTATPNDLIVAFDLTSIEWDSPTLKSVQERLAQGRQSSGAGTDYRPRSLEGAVRVLPEANLAIISVPGSYAAREARKALDLGLHVLMFSDNVSLDDEVNLKQHAKGRGLLMMGPDCGTAIINGAPLGFANAVPRGRVGLVSASGSGLQQVICLLAQAGEGISHGLGVGGRDLSEKVNGVMMLEGLRALQEDPATELIVLISKPPAESARNRVLAAIAESPKPCVVALLGESARPTPGKNVYDAKTLEDAALRVLNLLGKGGAGWTDITAENEDRIQSLSAGLAPEQRCIRGLYSGGTLCYEALLLLREFGHEVSDDLDSGGSGQSGDDLSSRGHVLTDLGDDRYTVGRPHPMIDFRSRCDRLAQEASDPAVGVLLLDVILGYGAHPDPAAELGPALREAQQQATSAGRRLACVVSMCGSPDDPQGLLEQEQALTKAGAVVVHSNALAARIASAISRCDPSQLPKR